MGTRSVSANRDFSCGSSCTCVIIAHRLSTIRDCDEIIVMDRGKIVQRAGHDDLYTAGGPYQRLINA